MWPAAWPAAGFNSLRGAGLEQRAGVLAAWAAESTPRAEVKTWVLAYWGESPVQKDMGDLGAEWRRGVAVLLTWRGERGVVERQLLPQGDTRRLAVAVPASVSVPRAGEEAAAAVDAVAEELHTASCPGHARASC